MRIRAIDSDGDWTFGKGVQNYLLNQNAIALDIKTRLYSFLNDCFFDAGAGVDWFNLLGSKNEAAILFSIKSILVNTQGVNSVTDISAVVDENRNLSVSYGVTTVFGEPIQGDISFPSTPFSGISNFVQEVVFTGQPFIDVDVSSNISDAQNAIWSLYDESNGFAPVVGAVFPISHTTVRIMMSPSPTGTFKLVGIS